MQTKKESSAFSNERTNFSAFTHTNQLKSALQFYGLSHVSGSDTRKSGHFILGENLAKKAENVGVNLNQITDKRVRTRPKSLQTFWIHSLPYFVSCKGRI